MLEKQNNKKNPVRDFSFKILKATVKAVEVCDKAIGKVVNLVLSKDGVVLITADHDIRLERSLRSGEFSKEDFEKRNENQIPDEEKKKRADFVFINNGSKDDLFKKADLLLLSLNSL